MAPIGQGLAEIELSGDFLWMDAEGTRELMQLMENPVNGSELATVTSAAEDEYWYLIFEWDEIGFVEDEEGEALDTDAMLTAIRKGNERANRERKRRGWATLQITGWQEKPHYDPLTHNLTWSVIGESNGERIINRNIRILGRRGVMSLTLVASPDELEAASATVDGLLQGYRFQPGNRYAEFVPGKDRLAEVGLTALVVGGAGALAVKSGLLARMWKLLVAGVVALAAGVRKLFGRKGEERLRGVEQASAG
jgi:uncharacterized membrane-anchored protein